MADQITQARLGILIGKRNYHAMRELLLQMNDVDIADFLNALPQEEVFIVYRMLPKHMASLVFVELNPEMQEHLLTSITGKEINALMDTLAIDDAVDLLEEMPSELVVRITKNASYETRALLNQYLSYPEDSVGSIMTAEYTDLHKEMTVAQAIAHIRAVGEDKETIYTCYVVGKDQLLEGILTVRDLMRAQDNQLVESIMQTSAIAVHTTSNREEAAQVLRKYSMISLPVVDSEQHLVGIVTIDDAADVLQEQATEDLERMVGIASKEHPYLLSGVLELAKNRFVWLLVLMISGIFSELILGQYEAAISGIPLLVAFIPMLTDMGGDAGSQVSTLVIRGMALGEISVQDTLAVVFKEIKISLMISLPLGALNYLRVTLGHDNQPMVALVISFTLICTITMANTLGVVLPMIAKKLRMDPALMATPMIATLVDIFSMMIYFAIATAMLHI